MSFSKAMQMLIVLEGGLKLADVGTEHEAFGGVEKRFYLAKNPGAIWPPAPQNYGDYCYAEYWRRGRCGELGEPADAVFYQFFFNAEVGAVKALQVIVRERPDGVLGPKTIAAVQAYGPKDIADRLIDLQRMHYAEVREPSDPLFAGLQNRVATVEEWWSEGKI